VYFVHFIVVDSLKLYMKKNDLRVNFFFEIRNQMYIAAVNENIKIKRKNFMSKHFILFLVLTLYVTPTQSQINGTVLNEKSQPLVGVNIINETNGKHTHTNENGTFQLNNYAAGDLVQFSFIGYKKEFITIRDNQQPINVVMVLTDVSLDDVVITPGIDAMKLVSDIDIDKLPVTSSQDILRQVPGILIGQHAGGGKAEQIFLRGFDIDHGTDLSINVDGMPVNMVSHAHGQGYADLHFIIPETIDDIEYGKGPYDFAHGNFATAGFVDFQTKDSFDDNEVKVEVGQFDTKRMVGLLNILDNPNNSALVATEFLFSDGPFDSSQHFKRINVFGKYSGTLSNADRIGVTASHFTSDWDASGQIPVRAVEQGLIGRFGAIDDTEGGFTKRTNIGLDYHKHMSDNSTIEANGFYSNYGFELYSNFTFFLEDPMNGDQIKQKELRDLYGFNTEYTKYFTTNSFSGDYRIGVSLRNDTSNDNELSRTRNRRETLEMIQFGDVDENNLATYADVHFDFGKLTINPSLRFDYFDFSYRDKLAQTYEQDEVSKAVVSPKLNFLLSPNSTTQYFLKLGRGFHSNDSRVILAQTTDDILPAAHGADLGFIWKPSPSFLLNTTAWILQSEQEFVYVGDAGIIEPSGESFRQGLELSTRFQPNQWLFANADVTYTKARATEEPDGQDFIPLAPDFIFTGGLSADLPSGFFAGVNVRHVDDRPANEDNSIVADGYTVADLNTYFEVNDWTLGVQILNLFDTEWNETQFATESRLNFENESTEEIHFTPGTPFFLKGIVSYKF